MQNKNGCKCLLYNNKNAESLYLCRFPAFVLSNGSSLALFVGGVIQCLYHKMNKPPVDIDVAQMTETQLHAKLQRLYDDYKAGRFFACYISKN